MNIYMYIYTYIYYLSIYIYVYIYIIYVYIRRQSKASRYLKRKPDKREGKKNEVPRRM